MTSITEKIKQISQELPEYVRLIAVTKNVSVEAMREAYSAGIRDFGENRLQEALIKQKELEDLPDICWHFIGHLQANKAKKVLEHFPWIHSVDTLKLAQRLNNLTSDLAYQPQICLQVKILPDPNKYGWNVEELFKDLPQLNQCYRIKIRGLMTIMPLGLSAQETLKAFEMTRNLAHQIQEQNWSNIEMKELSMGMSGDYLLALQAGATMIRLGTIIFGKRLAE